MRKMPTFPLWPGVFNTVPVVAARELRQGEEIKDTQIGKGGLMRWLRRCSGLNKNFPHKLGYLDTWPLLLALLGEGLGGTTPALKVSNFIPLPACS